MASLPSPSLPSPDLVTGHMAGLLSCFPEDAVPGGYPPSQSARRMLLQAELGWCHYAMMARLMTEAGSDLAGLFGLKPGAVLAIAPVSSYIEPLIPLLRQQLRLVLADTHKAGQEIGGEVVRHPDELAVADAPDAIFIPTNDAEIAGFFLEKLSACFPRIPVLTCLEVLGHHHERPGVMDAVRAFRARVLAAQHPILVVSTIIHSTLYPTYRALEDAGHTVFYALRAETGEGASYSSLPDEVVPPARRLTISFHDMLELLSGPLPGCVVWLVAESLCHPAWDLRRTLPAYRYTEALTRFTETNLLAVLYDAVKPANRSFDFSVRSAEAYRSMLSASKAVLFSSNTAEMGEFLSRAAGLSGRRLHFLRYGPTSRESRPIDDGRIHIAAISMLLDEFDEPSRNPMKAYVRNAVEQGLVIHYYTNYPAAERFRDTLPSEMKNNFCIHPVLRDAQKLVDEISCYHAGWVVHDQQVFSRIVAQVEDQLLRDVYSLFPATTMPTSALMCVSAGLPIIINRAMRGAIAQFPPEVSLPVEMSELHQLRAIIESEDWAWRRECAAAFRPTIEVRTQICLRSALLKEFAAGEIGAQHV